MITRDEIRKLRRDVESGLVTVPQFPNVVPRPSNKRFRREKVAKPVCMIGDWNDEAYHDNFYDDNCVELDVAPDYFSTCEQLVTTYADNLGMDKAVPSQPLFRGSGYTSKDLARFLLSFRARHMKVGDGILANMVAMLATFLPPDNSFKSLLSDKPTIYTLLKALDNLAEFKTGLRTLKINSCVNKCMGFYAEHLRLNSCQMCGESRWKHCASDCYGVSDERICSHALAPRCSLYYNVVQDRLVKLLKSDIKNLFNYDYHRAGTS
jgi:hypothetical protein